MRWFSIAVLVSTFAVPASVSAHGGHGGTGGFGSPRPKESRYRFEGTVTTVHDGRFEVKTNDGIVVPISLANDTQYRDGKSRSSSSMLEVGAMVKIEASGSKDVGILTARKITRQKVD